MAISEDEFKELMRKEADIEKITSISSDGKTLITRIPKVIVEKIGIKKGNKFRWLVSSSGLIRLTVEKNGKKNS